MKKIYIIVFTVFALLLAACAEKPVESAAPSDTSITITNSELDFAFSEESSGPDYTSDDSETSEIHEISDTNLNGDGDEQGCVALGLYYAPDELDRAAAELKKEYGEVLDIDKLLTLAEPREGGNLIHDWSFSTTVLHLTGFDSNYEIVGDSGLFWIFPLAGEKLPAYKHSRSWYWSNVDTSHVEKPKEFMIVEYDADYLEEQKAIYAATDHNELALFTHIICFHYVKEGVDVYAVPQQSTTGCDRYRLHFTIDNYAFTVLSNVYSMKNNTLTSKDDELIPCFTMRTGDEWTEAKEKFAASKLPYDKDLLELYIELSDPTTETSEMMKTLKAAVANKK